MKNLILAALLFFYVSPIFAWQEIVDTDFQYKFSSAAGVSTIKTGPGFLHSLTIDGGTTSPFNIYDGAPTLASLMYSFTSVATVPVYMFDVRFASGCTVISNGAVKYTVSYK